MTDTPDLIAEKHYNIRCKLLDEVSANSTGVWRETEGQDKFSIHVVVSANASLSVTLRGSNEDGPDDVSDDGVDLVAAGLTQLAANATITASQIAKIACPIRWVKAKAVVTSGNVSAFLEGV